MCPTDNRLRLPVLLFDESSNRMSFDSPRFPAEIQLMKWLRSLTLASVVILAPAVGAQEAKKDVVPDTISYYKDVRPLIQQHCQGCHQPAKAQGGYIMTSYADLFNKTDNDAPGIVAGKLDDSEVYQQIISHKGAKPAMPRGKEPLSEREVLIVKK